MRGDGRADPKPPPPPPNPPGGPMGPTRGLRKRGEKGGSPRGHRSPEAVRAPRGMLSGTSFPPASLPPPPTPGPLALSARRSKLRALSGWLSDCESSACVRLESREPSRETVLSPCELQRLRAVMGRLSHSVTLSSRLSLWSPSLPSSISYVSSSSTARTSGSLDR
jgi:hypothetical protein